MHRFNSFTMIHKALRAMLYDTALLIQQTFFADHQEAAETITKIETVLYTFEQHAHHEDTVILPLIEVYEQQLVRDFESEHIKDMELGDRLKHLINIFNAAKLDEEKQICGSAISKSFVEFMVFNLQHMAKEEVLINQALWKHYTNDQLILVNQRLAASVPAEEKVLVAKWMVRGATNQEIIAWLKGVQSSSPDFVFKSLFGLTETELPKHRKEKIGNAFGVQHYKEPEVELV